MPTFNLADPTRFINPLANREDEFRQNRTNILGEIGTQAGRGFIDIANKGIFGTEGLSQINRQEEQFFSQRRKGLSDALRKKSARRLGTRAGNVDQLTANAFAQNFGQQAQGRTNRLTQNFLSRIQGLRGLMSTADIFKLIEEEEEGGGFLDTLLGFGQAGLDIASVIPGPQQPFAMAGSTGLRAVRGSSSSGATNRPSAGGLPRHSNPPVDF